jgi:hypothetical protein
LLYTKFTVKRVFEWICVTLFAVFSILLPSLTHAQAPDQGINLQISPLPIELDTKPGTVTSADLRVRNAGSQPEKLQVRLLKVSEDDNGIVHLTEPGKTDEWVHWVSFSRTVFDAPSGQWQTIKMKVSVPKSAAFGYYYAVEYLRANEAPPEPGKAAARGAVATFILLNADSPGAKREAKIVSFNADRKSYEFLPAKFTVKVKSTGNVHVAPHGNVFINRGGKQVGVIAINGDEGNVLPSGSRLFSSSWSDGFPVYQTKTGADGQPQLDKKNQVQKSLRWDFSHANRLRFGHYTAHLVMAYDNGQRDVPMEASVSFWVVPWRLIGAVLGLVALIAALITYIVILRRRLKRASVHSGRRFGRRS